MSIHEDRYIVSKHLGDGEILILSPKCEWVLRNQGGIVELTTLHLVALLNEAYQAGAAKAREEISERLFGE